MMILQKMIRHKMASAQRVVRAGLMVLLMLSCASLVSLRAQEPSQPAAPEQKQSSSNSTQQSAQQAPQQPSPQAGGPGRQLVHESKEAAGEEKDEFAEFKQSASVRGIARLTGLNLQQSYWLSLGLNFVVIAGVVVWAARKYLPGIFRDRTAGIQKAMQEAQKASEEARRRLADIESRLMRLDGEIGMMRDAAEKDAAADEARIQAAAQEDARKIVESAQQEIASAAKSARRELTAYAAELAVGLAQKQIHVDAATDRALVRTFAGELGASEGSTRGPGKDGR